jgi:hypothetical protein
MYVSDERQGYVAASIHAEFAGQLLLAKRDDAYLVARSETILARFYGRKWRQPRGRS